MPAVILAGALAVGGRTAVWAGAVITEAGLSLREVYSEDDNLEAVFQYLVSK